MKDINLLPDDIKTSAEPFKVEKSNTSPVKLITIIIALLVLIGATFILPKVIIMTQNTRLDLTNKGIESSTYDEVKQIKSNIVAQTGRVETKNMIISAIDNESYPISQVLSIVKSSLPEGCKLTKINFDNDILAVEGKAFDSVKPAELLTNIRRLSSITVNATDMSKIDGLYLFKFKFNFDRKGGK